MKPTHLRLADYLLVAGLPFTVFSALRADWMPIGAGEIMVALWILFVLMENLGRSHPAGSHSKPFKRAVAIALQFWVAAVPLMIFATIVDLFASMSNPPDRYRDVFAYTLVIILCFALRVRSFNTRDWLTIYGAATVFFVVSTLISLTYYLTTGSALLGIEYDGRFAAFSKNANQPNVFLAPIPFFSIYFGKVKVLGRGYPFWLSIAAGAVAVGSQTGSDGLMLAWLVGTATFFFVLGTEYVLPGRKYPEGPIVAALAIFTLFSIGGVAVYETRTTFVQHTVGEVTETWDGGDSRLILWSNAATKLQQSPIIGFGIGAHSYFDFGDTQTGTEAHNFLVDWSLQTGAVGLCLLLVLLTYIGVIGWRSRQGALLAALIAVVVSSLTSYFMRHPIFWLNLVTIACASFAQIEQRKLVRPMPPHFSGIGSSVNIHM